MPLIFIPDWCFTSKMLGSIDLEYASNMNSDIVTFVSDDMGQNTMDCSLDDDNCEEDVPNRVKQRKICKKKRNKQRIKVCGI